MTTKRALVVGPLMPEYDREGGSRRIFHLLDFLQSSGWTVSYLAQNASGGERYARVLRQRGIAVYAGSDSFWAGDEYLSDPARLFATAQFDVAILAFWTVAETYLPLLRAHSPGTKIIIDSIDLHFVRQARKVFCESEVEGRRRALDDEYGRQTARELNTYAAADGVMAVSQKEADLIGDFTGNPRLAHLVPLMEDIAPSSVPFVSRHGILFIGNFRHPPNIDALEYLCRDIAPRIEPSVLEKHPIYIVGNGLERVRELLREFDTPYLRPIGWVPSLLPYLHRARITVAPLTYGAGTKTKLIQALTVGTPSVVTPAAAEGLNVQSGEHLLICGDPDDFAQSVCRLIWDENLWHTLARQGRERIVGAHGPEQVRSRFLCCLSRVLSQPAANIDTRDGSPTRTRRDATTVVANRADSHPSVAVRSSTKAFEPPSVSAGAASREFISICGFSSVGKKTLIEKILRGELRERFGITGSVEAFGYAFDELDDIFHSQADHVLYQWQFKTDKLIEELQEVFRGHHHRAILIWRPWEEHFRDWVIQYEGQFPSEPRLEALKTWWAEVLVPRFRMEMPHLGIPVELVDGSTPDYRAITWDDVDV